MPHHESEEPLRLRRCHNVECNALCTNCPCCGRGQRYCGPACRQRAPRAQVAAAGRRYQAADAGRADHRQRQSRYRRRSSAPRVKHQRFLPTACPASIAAESLSRCSVCGRTSRWHYSFYPLPRRRLKPRRARPRVDAQISTFSDGRLQRLTSAIKAAKCLPFLRSVSRG